MTDEEERIPTHRVHFEGACDVTLRGHGFRIHRTHEARVRQAGYCYAGDLIPERCRFGPRRLVLAGTALYAPPRYGVSKPGTFGADLVVAHLRWTCHTLYGMDRGPLGYEPEPGNLRLAVRVETL